MYVIFLTLAWGTFALYYYAMLRQATFFHLNRWYLMGTLLLTPLLPFLATDHVATGGMLPQVAISAQAIGAAVEQSTRSAVPWLLRIWAGGSILAAIRLLLTLARLLLRLSRAQSVGTPGYAVITGAEQPFSFFKWIILPENTFESHELSAVLRHETAHVKGWHSLDVLLSEVVIVLFWWHPLPYWYRRAIRLTHEYIADAASVRHFSFKQYGLLLIRQGQSRPAPALVHPFFHSPLKQRLAMLAKQHSRPVQRWRYFMTLPILLLLLSVSQLKAQQETKPPQQLPEYKGGVPALIEFLSQNIKYPEAARKEKAEGTIFVKFIVNKAGKVEDAQSLKAARQDLIDEAIRVVNLTEWTPAMKDGEKVKCEYTLPIKFKLE